MPTLSYAEVARYASEAGFRGNDVVTATAIAFGESGGNPRAVNHNTDKHRSTDFGLWQINDYWNPEILASGSWSNPADNARMAYAIFKAQGWGAWYAYKNGTYLVHMPRAKAAGSAVPVSSTKPAPAAAEPVTGNGGGLGGRQWLTGVAGIALVIFAASQIAGVSIMDVIPVGKALKVAT